MELGMKKLKKLLICCFMTIILAPSLFTVSCNSQNQSNIKVFPENSVTVTPTETTFEQDTKTTLTVQHRLNVSVYYDDSGTVTPTSGFYDDGASVTINAQPAAGYIFDHWTGSISSTNGKESFSINSDMDIIAHFKALYSLKILINPDNSGKISVVNPDNGLPVSPEKAGYKEGTVIELIAEALPGYRFDSWSGDISGTSNPINVMMNSNKSITANFKRQYTLKASHDRGGYFEPVGKDIGGLYDEGSSVKITAAPFSGYLFDYWSGAPAGSEHSSTLNLNMDTDKDIVAHFIPEYTSAQIDQFILQLSFSESTSRIVAYQALEDTGDYISQSQIEKIENIMRNGTQSWEIDSWREGHCTWHVYASVKYYAAEVIRNINSQYVSRTVEDEASEISNSAFTKERITDPGWI
jgi:hypothetical protein